jgi:hypothetical protein
VKVLLFDEEERRRRWWGMEYLVSLVEVGMQVFLCFQDDKEVGCKFFRTRRRRSEWNVLQMWGLRRRRM